MATERHLTAQDFDQAIAQGVVLVDFWANWCRPCKMLAPVLSQLAEEYDGKATIAKVDVDDQGALAEKFGIMSIPSLLLFKDGQLVDKLVGAMPKADLAAMLDKHL